MARRGPAGTSQRDGRHGLKRDAGKRTDLSVSHNEFADVGEGSNDSESEPVHCVGWVEHDLSRDGDRHFGDRIEASSLFLVSGLKTPKCRSDCR